MESGRGGALITAPRCPFDRSCNGWKVAVIERPSSVSSCTFRAVPGRCLLASSGKAPSGPARLE